MSRTKSLRTRMMMQYAALVLVCMIIIPTAISWLLTMQIHRFAGEKLAEDEQQIMSIVVKIYKKTGSWEKNTLAGFHSDILRWPMVSVAVMDNGKNVLAVARHEMPKRMPGRAPFGGKRRGRTCEFLQKHDKDIVVDGRRVGVLRFVNLPFNDSREGLFLRKFIKTMLYGVVIMVITAMALAYLLAGRISKPVLDTAKRASLISGGDYRAMSDQVSSNITEMQVLMDSIDRLGLGLEEQEKLRKRLMSDIAHELRNPVTVIKSHLEAFEDGVWQPTTERLKLTVSEIDRLSQLISEVEKLTVIEGAESRLAISVTNLSELAEKSALAFAPLFENKSVKLERSIEAGVDAEIDPAKIRQVMENLLSNALRYTDAGGMVNLSLKKNGGSVRFIVRDSGIGISKTDLPYIFERFYRTDKSRARASGGIGIGLAIVKAIITAHNGTIRVESAEGKGSSFIVTLPIHSDNAADKQEV